MSRVEKHPTDKGKFQSTFDSYGHGKGNGKSRASVYKHFKNLQNNVKNTKKENRDTESLPNSTKTNQEEERSDFVEDDSTKTTQWQDISWLNDDELEHIQPSIASPIRKLASGEGGMTMAQRATQTQLIRWGYMGIDRGVTHWGRGVMNDDEWEIVRHPMDYDAMEKATTHAMDANGLSINLSPTLVWGVVMASAYGPPLGHIAKNSDPLLRKTAFRRFFKWLSNPRAWFKRRRQPPPVQRPFHGNTFRDESDES